MGSKRRKMSPTLDPSLGFVKLFVKWRVLGISYEFDEKPPKIGILISNPKMTSKKVQNGPENRSNLSPKKGPKMDPKIDPI